MLRIRKKGWGKMSSIQKQTLHAHIFSDYVSVNVRELVAL